MYAFRLPLILLFIAPLVCYAATDEDIIELKKQMLVMQKQYAMQMQQLQQQINALEHKVAKTQQQNKQLSKQVRANPKNANIKGSNTDTAVAPSQTSAPRPTVVAVPVASSAVEGYPVVTSNPTLFNPQLSTVLNAGFSHYTLDPKLYRIPGFQLGSEGDIAPPGFAIHEAELNLQASIDPMLYGNITAALEQEQDGTEIEVEEAYVRTQRLPHGLAVKAGRFFSGIGYMNSQHAHNWDFVDPPLVYRALFNHQYFDDGVQLRWQAPTDFYWELGAEAFAGSRFPAGDNNAGLGSGSIFTHIGNDLGVSHSWQLGLSYLYAKPNDRPAMLVTLDEDDATYNFTGNSRTVGLDAVWKWAPNGNATARQLILQGEIYHRNENGQINLFDDESSLDSTQNGYYLQGVYKFLPRWRVGLRYDRLWSDNCGDNFDVLARTDLLADGFNPYRISTMLDFSYSEFSRLRLQYNYDHSRPELDQQLMLQFIVSFGAHGAHQY